MANVFFGNLPLNYMEAELNSIAGVYGNVLKSTVWKDKLTGGSKGFGFVEFSMPQEAGAAIASLNGVVLEDGARPLEVRTAETPEQKRLRKESQKMADAIPGRMPGPMAGVGPASRYNPYGPPPAPVARPVRFAPPAPQSQAYNAGYGLPAAPPVAAIGSGPVQIPKVNPDEVEEGANIFVRGLSPNIDELTMYKVFGQFGSISSIRVEIDRASGLPKGYGFVQYFHKADAARALQGTNMLLLDGQALAVNFHQPKPRASRM